MFKSFDFIHVQTTGMSLRAAPAALPSQEQAALIPGWLE
jgi:hypothetical protein